MKHKLLLLVIVAVLYAGNVSGDGDGDGEHKGGNILDKTVGQFLGMLGGKGDDSKSGQSGSPLGSILGIAGSTLNEKNLKAMFSLMKALLNMMKQLFKGGVMSVKAMKPVKMFVFTLKEMIVLFKESPKAVQALADTFAGLPKLAGNLIYINYIIRSNKHEHMKKIKIFFLKLLR